MGFDWVSVRNIKIYYQTLTCGQLDVHAGVSTTTCWKLWSNLIGGLSDWRRESKTECSAEIYTAFLPPHSHTVVHITIQTLVLTSDNNCKYPRCQKTLEDRYLFWVRERESQREREREAVVEFILGQYGNSIEINHKTTMTLLSSWSYIYNSKISQNENSFFWSSFDKDLTWAE